MAKCDITQPKIYCFCFIYLTSFLYEINIFVKKGIYFTLIMKPHSDSSQPVSVHKQYQQFDSIMYNQNPQWYYVPSRSAERKWLRRLYVIGRRHSSSSVLAPLPPCSQIYLHA